MRRELANILTAYLMGWKSIRDCAEWLSSVDWNSFIDLQTQKFIGSMELLITEVLEGLRPEVEFWQEAATFVAGESGILFSQPMSMAEIKINGSSNNSSNPFIEISVGVGADVGESQSWSISPLPVSV